VAEIGLPATSTYPSLQEIATSVSTQTGPVGDTCRMYAQMHVSDCARMYSCQHVYMKVGGFGWSVGMDMCVHTSLSLCACSRLWKRCCCAKVGLEIEYK
jgi:hypothetical protein